MDAVKEEFICPTCKLVFRRLCDVTKHIDSKSCYAPIFSIRLLKVDKKLSNNSNSSLLSPNSGNRINEDSYDGGDNTSSSIPSNSIILLESPSPVKLKEDQERQKLRQALVSMGMESEMQLRLMQLLYAPHYLSIEALRDVIKLFKNCVKNPDLRDEVLRLPANPLVGVKRVKKRISSNTEVGTRGAVKQMRKELKIRSSKYLQRAGIKGLMFNYNDQESVMHALKHGSFMRWEEVCIPDESKEFYDGETFEDLNTGRKLYELRNAARSHYKDESLNICPLIMGSDGAQIATRGNRSMHPFHVTIGLGNCDHRNRKGNKLLLGYMAEPLYVEGWPIIKRITV